MDAKKLFDKESTYEELEMSFDGMDGKTIQYKDRILVSGYYNAPDGSDYFAAIYNYKDDNDADAHAADAPVVLHKISERGFEDDGQAIEWAILHCNLEAARGAKR